MPRPRLIIMAGPPAAGKTTTAPLLANALGMPVFSMDTIKERLADAIGERALDFPDQLGEAALLQVVAIGSELLSAGNDVLIEGFLRHGPCEPLLAPLVAMSDAVVIHLRADDLVLKDRYETRAVLPDRHWIHGDIARIGTLLPELPAELAAPLELGICRIIIDTSQGPISVEELVIQVNTVFSDAGVMDDAPTTNPPQVGTS